MKRTVNLLAACVALFGLCATASAGPIAAGSASYTYDNEFFVYLYENTPINPGPAGAVQVNAQGKFTQVWEEQVGDTIQDELTSIEASGVITTPGGPIPFDLYGGVDQTPDLGPFEGSLTAIVNDPGTGDLVSSFRTVGGPFRQVLAVGATLYTTDPYTFVSSIDTLPFEVGDTFFGTTNVEARLQLGPTIDPVNDPVVGLVLAGGVIEITSVIPEPCTAALAMLAVGAVATPRGRRRV